MYTRIYFTIRFDQEFQWKHVLKYKLNRKHQPFIFLYLLLNIHHFRWQKHSKTKIISNQFNTILIPYFSRLNFLCAFKDIILDAIQLGSTKFKYKLISIDQLIYFFEGIWNNYVYIQQKNMKVRFYYFFACTKM